MSNKKYEPLSVLNSRIRLIEIKKKELSREISEKQQEYIKLDQRHKSLNEKKKKLLTKEIEVSDHAIIRYQERVKLVTKEDALKEILNTKFVTLVDTLGPDGEYPIRDGVMARVQGRKIITIFVQ